MALIALKYQAKRGLNGKIVYPFDNLKCVARSGIQVVGESPRWAAYLKINGGCVRYDKVSTIDREDLGFGSPAGYWSVLILAPREFAEEAISVPGVEALGLKEVQDFWEKRITADQPLEIYDSEILSALAAKKALGKKMNATDSLALNPSSPIRGIRKNTEKKWVDFKSAHGIEIEEL